MSRRRNLVFGWVLAVVAIGVFAGLGAWQSRRAHEKQAMLDAADRVLADRSAVPLAAAAEPARARAYDWAVGGGRFDARGALLLDNQQREGRVGVRAYRLFLPREGDPLLVDLGWLPLAGDRVLPTVDRPEGELQVEGLLVPPPSTGIALGPALVPSGDGWLMTRVDMEAIGAATGMSLPPAPRVLRLDPASPLGYARDLALLPNTLPPDKHRGYAVQWFALALAVLATALILTVRSTRR
ncbi:SURF1 family protein [Lysobacter sp. A3-1-A15]|uniref:SURF1 family protein n=1 Tax=Novilysobacter viscosus TaxID=3098602 RepID=UPI002ED91726